MTPVSFTVTYEDGRVVVATAKAKDFVAFERQYGIGVGDIGDRLEHLYYLAWSPLHRSKKEPRAFDEFLDDVEDCAKVEEEGEAVPFPQAATATPSPGSL